MTIKSNWPFAAVSTICDDASPSLSSAVILRSGFSLVALSVALHKTASCTFLRSLIKEVIFDGEPIVS